MKINLLSDVDLVCNIQDGLKSEESLGELVNRHSGIFITMVNNYSMNHTSGTVPDRTDLLKDKGYYIYKAALKYDESKDTKFSTHLGNETRWLCLNFYNKNKKCKEVNADHQSLSNKQALDTQPSIDLEVLSKIMSMINKDPDNRVSKIFKMRYIEGSKNKVMPWHKICKPLKLSIQGCINIHNKTILKIKKELNKEL